MPPLKFFKIKNSTIEAAKSLQPISPDLTVNTPGISIGAESSKSKIPSENIIVVPPISFDSDPVIPKPTPKPSKFNPAPGDSVNQFPKQEDLLDLKEPSLAAFRPDILMLARFNPLFDTNGNKTDQGNLFDFHVESLRQVDVATNLTLKSIDKNVIKQQNQKAIDEIAKLRENLNTIADYIKFLNFAKVYSDFSSPLYTYNTLQFIQQNFNGTNVTKETMLQSSKTVNQKANLIDSISLALKSPKDIDSYSKYSTKTWVTAISELRNLIRFHSTYATLKVEQPGGNNEKENEKIFGEGADISTTDSEPSFLNPILTNTNLRVGPEDLIKDSNIVSSPTRFIELNELRQRISPYKYEQIALMSYVISKEFSHKSLIGSAGGTSDLSDRDAVLDTIFGKKTNLNNPLITDNQFTGNKLIEISHLEDIDNPNNTILTFEKPNPDVLQDTLQSGHEYFFNLTSPDSLNFVPINRIKRLKDTIDKTSEVFFNFMENSALIPSISDAKLANYSLSTSQSSLSGFNPIIFLSNIFDIFLDKEGSYRPYTAEGNNISNADLTIGALLYFANSNQDTGLNLGQIATSRKIKNLFYNNFFQIAQSGTNSDESNFAYLLLQYIQEFIDVAIKYEPTTYNSDDQTFSDVKYYQINLLSLKGNDILSIDESEIVQKIVKIFQDLISAGLQEFCPCIFDIILQINYAISPYTDAGLNYIGPKPAVDQPWNSGLKDKPAQAAQFHFYFRVLSKDSSTAKKYSYSEKVKSNAIDFKNSSIKVINRELEIFHSLSFSVLNTLKVLKSNIDLIYQKSLAFNDQVVSYVLNYLNGNLKKLGLFFNEQQLLIVLSYIEDLYQESQDFIKKGLMESEFFLKRFDSLTHSKNVVDILKKYLKDPDYNPDLGYDKQIMTVGIPHGLFKTLNLESSNDIENPVFNKQYDLFKILIYKMNLLEEGIVYKPKSFLFEASRFPVRINSMLLSDYANDPNLQSTIIPPGLFLATRNYVLFGNDFTGETRVSYWNEMGNFLAEEYGELTDLEKLEILNNHASSFLLENYIRIVSGLKINDVSCTINSVEELNELYSNFVDNPAIKNLVSTNSKLYTPLNMGLTDVTSYLKRIITPKKYDRVFNIIFDPKFEVDLDATQSQNQPLYISELQKKGIIELTGKFPNISWVDTNKSALDTIVNAYFVVIESYSSKKNNEII